MNNKKLAQLIKLIVEKEIKKQLPVLVQEEIKKSSPLLKESLPKGKVKREFEEKEYDAFQMANEILNEERKNNDGYDQSVRPQRQLSSNPVLNEILNETQPFSSAQKQEAPSVLDNYRQPIEENSDKTLSFDSNMAQGGVEGMRAQMAQKMGYGDVNNGPSKQGLGVSTGLPGLDRILNRDNSELVKRFKK